jgi:hypothetical protein
LLYSSAVPSVPGARKRVKLSDVACVRSGDPRGYQGLEGRGAAGHRHGRRSTAAGGLRARDGPPSGRPRSLTRLSFQAWEARPATCQAFLATAQTSWRPHGSTTSATRPRSKRAEPGSIRSMARGTCETRCGQPRRCAAWSPIIHARRSPRARYPILYS